jgi:hypothetical protein
MRIQSICLALAIVLLCPFASAQWVHTSIPNSGQVNCFAVSGSNLFAGTFDGGVFLSINNGTSWAAVNTGLTDTSVMALLVSDKNLFAGTYDGGVFLSTNNGTSWTNVSPGLQGAPFLSFAVSGTNLFAATYPGVFVSTNNGTSWTAAGTGLPYAFYNGLAVSGANIFASTRGVNGRSIQPLGVYLSTNNGTSWSAANTPFKGFLKMVEIGTNLFVGDSVVYLSTNNGTSWNAVASTGLAPWSANLAVSGTNLFAGNYGSGVFLSTNSGTNWIAVNNGLTDTLVVALAVSGTNLFAGGLGGGVWRRPLSEMVSVGEPTGGVPVAFSLHQNYPNPFNPSTTIKFELPRTSHVNLSVYDILGREVAVLVNERKDAGVHEVKFDGSNLASGVYLYRLHAGDFVASKRLVLLK